MSQANHHKFVNQQTIMKFQFQWKKRRKKYTIPVEQLDVYSFEIRTFLTFSVAIVVKSDMTEMSLGRETKGLFGQISTL